MTLFEIIGGLFAIIAVMGFVNTKYLKLPNAVGMTFIGLCLGLILAFGKHILPNESSVIEKLLSSIDFKEMVFHGMLGILLFAGGMSVCFEDLKSEKYSIILLSTLGVLISTGIVGFLSYELLTWAGITIAPMWCYVFGALIAPTDPIAVLGILKEMHISKDLENKITGESLFNDGTAVVVFMTLLALAINPEMHVSVTSVISLVVKEAFGGIIFGVALGWVIARMMKSIDSYEIETMITIAAATGGYAIAEHIHVSAPLAAVCMGLMVGNIGRNGAMTETTQEHLFAFWSMIDHLFNLVLFALIGLTVFLMKSYPVWYVLGLTPVIILMARYLSVFIPLLVLHPFQKQTGRHVKVLTWGGLRGGISIALALSLPAFEGKEILLAMTYVVVFFSLFVQCMTLPKLIRYCFGEQSDNL